MGLQHKFAQSLQCEGRPSKALQIAKCLVPLSDVLLRAKQNMEWPEHDTQGKVSGGDHTQGSGKDEG